MAKSVQVVAQIQIRGANPYVLIQSEQAALLSPAWRKPMPVLVSINGNTDTVWQTNLMPNGRGDFYLYLHGGMRTKTNTKVGDSVTVSLSFHESYRNGPMHAMPDWFQDALETNRAASTNWNSLPPSRRKEILRYFDGLKSDEAKNRNVARAITVLEGHDGRFMGRNWADGR